MGFIVRDKKMLSKCYCIFSRDTFEKKKEIKKDADSFLEIIKEKVSKPHR